MTIKMMPFWWESGAPKVHPKIDLASKSDVVVVGAGYAGLSAAITLGRAGRSVQVFDKMSPGEGASTRNGGLASGNIKISFSQLIKTIGMQRAKAIYEEGVVARQKLFKFIKEEKIECDFNLSGRFIAAFTPKHFESQAKEAQLLNNELGLEAYMISKTDQHKEIATDMYFGGMIRPDLGGLHPAKFHAALLKLTKKASVVIHGQCPVTKILETRKGLVVTTPLGEVIARDVIISTNGYTDRLDKWLQRRLIPIKSRMIATEQIPAETMARLMPNKRLFGETRTLFHYFRPSPDGTRILMGGNEGKNTNDPQRNSNELKNYLYKIFPDISDINISHYWDGNVAFNLDFLPRLFKRRGVTYATGFCGSGVVWAWWIGQKAALKLLNDCNSKTQFDGEPPGALPLYNGNPWFLPAIMIWFKLKDLIGASSKK